VRVTRTDRLAAAPVLLLSPAFALATPAELIAPRADLAEARNRRIAARVDLARATGQLDLAWIESNMEGGR
jgi:hypothetical protein